MCGIALLVTLDPAAEARDSMGRMLNAIRHRGPDDEGIWAEESVGLVLGHRRLSILDTSELGHQPMVSASGRYVIAYNGEIYNYVEMRAELDREPFVNGDLAQGAPVTEWRSGSDTEVLLHAIERWGLEVALQKSAGMFAFALYDRKEREIILARDRMGKKPLYYGLIQGKLLAASELGAFRAATDGLSVDQDAMALLTRFSFIPDPFSAFVGVKKLLPGTYLRLPVDGVLRNSLPDPAAYFRLEDAILAGAAARARVWEPEEVLHLIEEQLEVSVKQRLRTDVPFGAFLSGGIDSSLVVALMQKQLSAPVKTFALGFDDPAFDESKHAANIARHLGTEHRELIVTEKDVLDLVPDMVSVYDEPFADSSGLPTTLVARLASEYVTVVLTGDGGDELFAGYNRHVWGQRVWGTLSRTPEFARRGLAGLVGGVPASFWDGLSESLSPVLPERFQLRQAGEKARKFARLASCETPEAMHLDLATGWLVSERVTTHASRVRTRAEMSPAFLKDLSPLQRALWFDSVQGLPGDMLVKVDRASMSAGLEARQPLLDHRVYEASWQIPDEFKIRDGVGKWPLREVLAKHVPRQLFERPKSGFSVPIDAWLRGPLRDWAEDLLSQKKLQDFGVFSNAPVCAAWEAHLSGKQNHGARLWTVLSAQAWLGALSKTSALSRTETP